MILLSIPKQQSVEILRFSHIGKAESDVARLPDTCIGWKFPCQFHISLGELQALLMYGDTWYFVSCYIWSCDECEPDVFTRVENECMALAYVCECIEEGTWWPTGGGRCTPSLSLSTPHPSIPSQHTQLQQQQPG